jgi:hypothetical protein
VEDCGTKLSKKKAFNPTKSLFQEIKKPVVIITKSLKRKNSCQLNK